MTNYKGDFLDLLKAHDCQIQLNPSSTSVSGSTHHFEETEGTTVVAVRYKEGVIVAGDRRATAGTSVIYDRAEKLLRIDEYSVLAIAGSPAMAYEMARALEHSFQYFRRSQLQELSLEGKLRMLSRLIRENLPMTLQGIGGVIPIFALYDLQSDNDNGGKIFFYDALGAHFESADFATSGSGSVWIRGVLYYQNRWGETQLANMDEQEATITILRLLDAASEYDAATSGYNPKSNIFPTVKTITKDGIQDISDEQLGEIYTQFIETTHAR
ncbi:MAG: proteasome subunit alpha [Candidatus Poribacteria bacterium]|nr:proteasome subunit alpha [Candidatus Poribacteria bacterium]